MLSVEEQEKIKNEILKKIPSLSCPMCKTNKFSLSGGYFLNTLQDTFNGGLSIGGPAIPTASLICNNCGFVSQHAVGILGLLPKKDIEDESK